MLAFESRSSRRFFLSLTSGERLAQVLVEFMRAEGIDRAQLQASGRARWVRLASRPEEIRGALPFTLAGTVARDLAQSSELLMLVATEGAPIAGALVDAEVERCELVLVTFDALHSTSEVRTAEPVRPQPRIDPPRPEPRIEPRPAPAPAPASAPRDDDDAGVSWAELAHASRAPEPVRRPAPRPVAPAPRPAPIVRPAAPKAPPPVRGVPPVVVPSALPARKRTSEDEFFEEPSPEPGEYVEHAVFGLCRVAAEDSGAGLVIELPSGALKALNLTLFRVLEPRIEDDRIIYPVEPRKR
jgi:predicted DNA-binding protein with PD1-like motif